MSEILKNIVLSDTFWIALGSIGALFTLIMAYIQIRASRIISAADFLLKLEAKFTSLEMVEKRRKFMNILIATPEAFEKMDAFRDVFDFFEDVGLLLRKGILPKELVWSDYCHWILNYWTAFQGYIEWARRKDQDPTLYCEFELLYSKILSYEQKRLKRKVQITPEDTKEFINYELQLLSC